MTKTDTISKDSFDQDFCSILEFYLSKTFENSADKKLQGLWCDGVSHEAFSKTKKFVNGKGYLTTKAWIGKDGQDEYEMTINFGDKALRTFTKELDLKDCLPSNESADWFNIDTDKKTIELFLL